MGLPIDTSGARRKMKIVVGEDEAITVAMPRNFNPGTMYPFLSRAMAIYDSPGCTKVCLDFRILNFIEPVGVVVLSNLIEYLERRAVQTVFQYHRLRSQATEYLDDAGFFLRYGGERLFPKSSVRPTTMPLQRIDGPRSTEYLNMKLMPWIGRAVDQSPQSLDALRSSLEEIFHNFRDHSGVDAGCAFAQHFPSDKQIRIAIADFGAGIPNEIRRDLPNVDDAEAMRLACEEGFTTGKNGHNRGAGLPNLIRYVTRLEGMVILAAGNATLTALPHSQKARTVRGFFPGTMVQVKLPTGTLRRAAADVEPEDFEW